MGPYEILSIILAALVCVIGLKGVIRRASKSGRAANFHLLLLLGIATSFIALLWDGPSHWDRGSLIAFFSLRKGYRHYLLLWGYILIIWGFAGIFVTYFRKPKAEPKEVQVEGIKYVNAFFSPPDFQLHMTALLFIIVPALLFFIVYGVLAHPVNFIATFVILSLIAAFFGLLLSIWKKFWVFRAHLNDSGINFHKGLSEFSLNWSDVLSCKPVLKGCFKGKVAVLNTNRGTFCFPLTMLREAPEYPRLMFMFFSWEWKYPDGSEKPVSPETCELFMEIKRHIGSRQLA